MEANEKGAPPCGQDKPTGQGHPVSHPGQGHSSPVPELRLVAWEVTRTCNLACVHCRAAAMDRPYENELSTDECRAFLDEVASFARPIIILTGGEPLLRPDIFEIAAYGHQKGLRMRRKFQ